MNSPLAQFSFFCHISSSLSHHKQQVQSDKLDYSYLPHKHFNVATHVHPLQKHSHQKCNKENTDTCSKHYPNDDRECLERHLFTHSFIIDQPKD